MIEMQQIIDAAIMISLVILGSALLLKVLRWFQRDRKRRDHGSDD